MHKNLRRVRTVVLLSSTQIVSDPLWTFTSILSPISVLSLLSNQLSSYDCPQATKGHSLLKWESWKPGNFLDVLEISLLIKPFLIPLSPLPYWFAREVLVFTESHTQILTSESVSRGHKTCWERRILKYLKRTWYVRKNSHVKLKTRIRENSLKPAGIYISNKWIVMIWKC